MAIFRGTDIAHVETDEDDRITGTDFADNIKLYAGDDYSWGLGGNDSMGGGAGNDLLDGGAGNDRIWGDAGDDVIFGGSGNNYLSGGYGDDILVGDNGSTNTLAGGAGNDTIHSYGQNDIANGGSGDDYIYILDGRELGGAGDDTLATGSVNNELHAGPVSMTGGQGADLFYDGMAYDGAAQHVTVLDFNQAQGDRLSMGFLVNLPGQSYYMSTAEVFDALDTNRDGQVTGLQADGSGDQFTRYDAATNQLTIYIWDDSLTVNGNHIDWSMLA